VPTGDAACPETGLHALAGELFDLIGREQVMTPAPSDAAVIAASRADPDRFAEIFDRAGVCQAPIIPA
jgi:hypothetical protein